MSTETVERTLSQTPKNASQFGLKVARILDDIWALYNLSDYSRIDFGAADMITMKVRKPLATFDFDELTQLVVRCHDACIRLAIEPCNPKETRLRFSGRLREGGFSERHPTMEQAIERVRTRDYFTRR